MSGKSAVALAAIGIISKLIGALYRVPLTNIVGAEGMGLYQMVFPLYNVRFISINDDFDSDQLHGDTGGINVAFKYLISEFYSRDLSIKYKSAKYVRFRRGEYQSKRCPYG